jgi:acetyl esterase
MTPKLHPEARALMEIVARAAAPAFHTLDVPKAREEVRKMFAYFGAEPPPVASVRDLAMPCADGSGRIGLRLYRPFGSAAQERLPLLVFFHGGGWIAGDLDAYDSLCCALANHACCAVLSVDYRLAPEHPFPAAVDDAYAAALWAQQHAAELAVDAGRIAVGGDSAGGNLAAVTAILARDRGGPRLVFQLMVYPTTDQSSERPSQRQFGRGYLLELEAIRYFQRKYLPHPRDYRDWRASPLLRQDLAGLPPALVLSAGFDPLLDDCIAYVERLSAARVAVQHRCFDGMIHGFVTLGKRFTASAEAIELAASALRDAFHAATQSGRKCNRGLPTQGA